ncbi:hypothetical protein ACFX13_047903 [Malus domestica]|uniref:S-adenosylmethionine-dependent methyltransferase n=1 Tax=Malus domestica TaxID=3750 RepID=A0A498J9H8_MALDO|nr:hypothetical protein DVH24_035266 [Malus domestica]
MAAAVEDSSNVSEAYPMTGGDGPNSYAKNSIRQKLVVDAAKELLTKTIKQNLDLDICLPCDTFHIADLGCSVGPNTFLSVENILEAVKFEYQSRGLSSQIPEFQAFFNDHTLNDFNMLFKSLPRNRNYYAAGVPGSFYGRLFPKASIHFFHSSLAVHWLSRVPKDVTEKTSRAWNKGRIHYSNSGDEVVRAYQAQYSEDMECFLHARALETVHRGLVVLTLLGHHNGDSHSLGNVTVDILGSCLMDMARKGVVSEEKVDSFNIPSYCVSPQELEVIVERNGCFSIEALETLVYHVPEHGAKRSASTMRAATEGLIKQQFGEEILDELFSLYQQKIEEQISIFESKKSVIFFVVLKRKTN